MSDVGRASNSDERLDGGSETLVSRVADKVETEAS